MGEKDITEKTLLAYNDVFADILNVLLFNGEELVKAEDLTEAQTFSQYKATEGKLHGQNRDVAKYWNSGTICLSMFGFENQTVKDNMMPVRVISYDGASYRSQLTGKKDKIHPVITLILYFGTNNKWQRPLSLLDSLTVDPRLVPFVSDYKLNVFNLAWLTDEQIRSFKSDFRLVAEYLKAKRIGSAEEWPIQKLQHIDDILQLLKVVSDDSIFDNMKDFIIEAQKEKGGVNVCEFVQKMKGEGRLEGLALGRTEGITLGRSEGLILGENNVMSLISKLFAAGRASDVEKAANDREYMKQLMKEFGI